MQEPEITNINDFAHTATHLDILYHSVIRIRDIRIHKSSSRKRTTIPNHEISKKNISHEITQISVKTEISDKQTIKIQIFEKEVLHKTPHLVTTMETTRISKEEITITRTMTEITRALTSQEVEAQAVMVDLEQDHQAKIGTQTSEDEEIVISVDEVVDSHVVDPNHETKLIKFQTIITTIMTKNKANI